MTKVSKKSQTKQSCKTGVMRCFSIDDMKKCADFWNRKPIEQKYFLEFLKTIIK
jgi:hypothetical protein